ncbi:AcrR family transcriptional regulator [Mitsuaria sp. BK045]|uniref:TetR/AcrR family transcriptional regulator n=1 Tax=unclassified Roseateles TaxID=2626991 RepID=UPI00161E5DEB|nr:MULTISPECIES: TetR/AcrR family transcriptional regulator [unclassified Roseateles]MBB3291773.1 AcrR family transcriptional regulator [Mitsuaria sp. BK041]MBB3360990.1 AcrR family transcriptional regulator [Mitsuaria sp. BK045]
MNDIDGSVDIGELPARDRILRTAHGLFYGEGIRATGIDRVIAASGVTKVTFYRHFPSKNDLIVAYLDMRHARWMAWFSEALARHGDRHPGALALVPAMGEWFRDEALGDYRGCAFLNGVGEMGPALPEVVEITRRHKQDMTDAIVGRLPASRQRRKLAAALALAVDGAIVQAQFADDPAPALKGLQLIVESLTGDTA